jgi:hypothetical protein
LSSFEVKVRAIPLLATAEDEPTAFELLLAADGADPAGDRRAGSDRASDAEVAGPGRAAAPDVPRDLR